MACPERPRPTSGSSCPGALSILALAWVYVRFGAIPKADAFLSGLNAAVVGIIVAITVKMARTSVARPWQMGVVGIALMLSLLGRAGPLEVAFVGIGAGLGWDLGIERARLLRFRRKRWREAPQVALPEEGRPLREVGLGREDEPASPDAPSTARKAVFALAGLSIPKALLVIVPLAVVFFRTGLGSYGGGFAIIPGLHTEVVREGWLTEHQFADAVAVGKLTPGPVLLMATFIGYLKQGLLGALIATVSILAAPFALVVTLSAWLVRMRSRRWMRAALRGLTPAVVGLMLAAALVLGRTMQTTAGLAIAAATALTLVRFEKVNPVAMLALGGAVRLGLRLALGIYRNDLAALTVRGGAPSAAHRRAFGAATSRPVSPARGPAFQPWACERYEPARSSASTPGDRGAQPSSCRARSPEICWSIASASAKPPRVARACSSGHASVLPLGLAAAAMSFTRTPVSAIPSSTRPA